VTAKRSPSAVHSGEFFWARLTSDVAVLRWPDDQEDLGRLARLGLPRLLVVEADAPAPESDSCLEDWIRLPATDEDIRARLIALSHHAVRHPSAPHVDPWGQLSFRDMNVFLSPREYAIVQALVDRFGTAVSEEELIQTAWPDYGTETALRVHCHRLRKRLAPLGLTVKNIRGYGYMMHQVPS
jgi:Transcriptional regulatory protein, C terminal